MREIKFRAWSKKYGVMFQVGGFSNMTYPSDDPYNYVTIAGRSPEGMLDGTPILNTIDLMQYTGLKDSKGVEIYEGDVVDLGYGGLVKVEWEDDLGDAGSTFGCGWPISGDGYGVVLGNIYENPELLEAKS